MLEDRPYMRQPRVRAQQSATVMLLIALGAAFIGQTILERSGFPTNKYLALSLEGLRRGYVWQLLSYQFMHADLLHLLFNGWAVFVFGRELEDVLGRGRYFTLYFSSGIIGGLVQIVAGLVSARYGGSVVGASAAAFGLVAAFALLFPDRVLLLFFIIPVRAKLLLVFEAVFAVGSLALAPPNPGGGIAHAAHLGGMITGILFIRYASQWEWPHFRWPRRQHMRRVPKASAQKGSLWGRDKGGAQADLPPDEFLSREVDPILDKISAQGIQSLTERERRILEAARERMVKR